MFMRVIVRMVRRRYVTPNVATTSDTDVEGSQSRRTHPTFKVALSLVLYNLWRGLSFTLALQRVMKKGELLFMCESVIDDLMKTRACVVA